MLQRPRFTRPSTPTTHRRVPPSPIRNPQSVIRSPQSRLRTQHSAFSIRSHKAFTVLEMLTTVAALIIVLGLMVSLARYVRNELSIEVTKDLLHRLDDLTQQYIARHNQLPNVDPFIPASHPLNEQSLQQSAVANNRSIVSALRQDGLLEDRSFGGLPQSIYNDMMIRDAWGSPIIFMPAMHEGLGMAPENKPFFFSAGPDQRFLTPENNLYSYEK